ncbi:MAG: lysophospholipid acyltransferase family protein [Pseudomonadota bacterium]
MTSPTITTWKEAEPPELPAASPAQKLRGSVRITIAILITVLGLAVFMIGKGLRNLFGDWVFFHYRVARIWSRAMLMLLGMRLVVRGAPIRKGGILVSNHVSWADILALRAVTRVNFVSKAEVRNWPGIGFIAEICETVFIERRRTEAKRQQHDLFERIERDELLCVFPEGTSTDGLRVLPFKSALMSVLFIEGVHEHALVQPVSLVYRPNPKHDLPSNFYGWWGSMPFEGHIWQVAQRSQGGSVEVVYHDPMRAADWDNRKELTAKCEADVFSAFPEEMRAAGRASI